MRGGNLSGDCFCLFPFERLVTRLTTSPVFKFTRQERLKIGFLINSVLQENKMRQRHQELRLQREKMTAHMVQRTNKKKEFMTCSFPSGVKGIDVLPNFKLKRQSFSLQELTCPPSIPRNQNECLEEVKKHQEEVRVFHETYDTIVAQDKVS